MTDNQLAQRAPELDFTIEQKQLIRDVIAPGATESELAFFIETARMRGLNPLTNQIHFIARGRGEYRKVTFQTGIDAFRLIAERTGNYVPGRAPTFEYDANGRLVSATAYVKKFCHGEWHEFSATAFFDEYVQTTHNGEVTQMWRKMPHSQLQKCSEALALRKGFPEDLSGLYTTDEMGQAENEVAPQSQNGAVPAAPVEDAAARKYNENLQRGMAKYERLRLRAEGLGLTLPDGRVWPKLKDNFGDVQKLAGWCVQLERNVKAAEAAPKPDISQPANGGGKPLQKAIEETYDAARQGNPDEEEQYFGDGDVVEGEAVETPAPEPEPKRANKSSLRAQLLECLQRGRVDTSEAAMPALMERVNRWRLANGAQNDVQHISEMSVAEMSKLIVLTEPGTWPAEQF